MQEKAHQAADVSAQGEGAGRQGQGRRPPRATAADKVTPSGNGDHAAPTSRTSCNPDNVARQDNPYPQGDLP